MKRIFETIGAVCFLASAAQSQGTAADSVHVGIQRTWIDSLTRNVQPALARYCSSRTAVKYMKDACAIFDRQLPRLNANENAWLIPTTPPDTSPTPPPVDCGIAECPRVTVKTAYPVPVRIVDLPAPSLTRTILSTITFGLVSSGDLQTALNNAQPGDEIRLADDGVYSGNFTWARCLSGYVTITGKSGPNEGTRVTPNGALAYKYPLLISGNTSPVLLVTGCKLRVARVEVSTVAQSATVNYNYGIIQVGNKATTIDAQPQDIVLDRLWVHGSDSTQIQNAIKANGRSVAVIDSWINKVRWKGVESHCVVVWESVAGVKVQNNHLDCAGIGILVGGAARSIPGIGPSDIEILRNHVTKDSSYIGYVAKNGIEMKDIARVRIESNVIDHSYFGAQTGMLVNLQSVTDQPDSAVQATDVAFRWNRLSEASQCIVFSARGYNGVAKPMTRVQIDNNLCTDIGSAAYDFGGVHYDGMSRISTMSGDIQQLKIQHNTFVKRMNGGVYTGVGIIADTGPATGTVYTDNVYGPGRTYGCWFRSGGLTGIEAMRAFDPGFIARSNVCWENQGKKTPLEDFFPLTQADVGFAPDWSLLPTSAYKGKGTDGKDPGANIEELTKRLVNVVVTP